jgi:iron complex outermembrane receptor protein
MDVQLKYYPAAASIVDQDALKTMPRSVGSEEPLMFVPGVRVDNQANGERVHMSIRGQGILTERGLRGIKVLIDGIPLNDPSGFAPDLFDLDWSLVDRIEVLKGPAASYYGGSGAAGVLNITTKGGEAGGLGGFNKEVSFEAGSNAFIKGLVSADGKTDNMDYRVSFSRGMVTATILASGLTISAKRLIGLQAIRSRSHRCSWLLIILTRMPKV